MIDVVGLGAAGWASLGSAEQALVTAAEVLVGSPRQLDLVPAASGQQRRTWPRDLRAAAPELLGDHDRHRLVVLASGDPLCFGVGSTLVDLFGADVVRVHPAVSSVALAAARMGWPADGVEVVRVVRARADEVRRALAPGRRLVVLSRDGGTPARVVEVLRESGFAASEVTVLCDLGAAAERRLGPSELATAVVPALNVVAVRCRADRPGPAWSTVPGLAEEAYEHDGQLTKRDLRASALARLMPVPGQLLWDLGAGSGSVAIEWSRTHPTCRAVAVERDPVRAARIEANAARLGVPQVRVVVGAAAERLAELPAPDAVFVGGGLSDDLVDRAWTALRAGGRLVAHAVTLETETAVVAARARLGGELVRISVETLAPLGGYEGWKPARAVVQWAVQKGIDA